MQMLLLEKGYQALRDIADELSIRLSEKQKKMKRNQRKLDQTE